MREFDAIPGSTGRKIIDGLKDAVAGNFSAVIIEGQRWVRADTAGWQPIDSAPKDGTEVIVYDGKSRGDAYYDGEDDRWYWANTGRGDWPDPRQFFPTHWMPLPPAPEPQP